MIAELEQRRRGLENRCKALERDRTASTCFEDEIKCTWRIAAARDRLKIYDSMDADAARGLSWILTDSDGAIKWLNAERKRITQDGRKTEFTTTEIVQLFEIDEAIKDLLASDDDRGQNG